MFNGINVLDPQAAQAVDPRGGGILGALRGLGQRIRGVDPMTWLQISSAIGQANDSRYGTPIGNLMRGIGAGVENAQQIKSMKQIAADREEERKMRREEFEMARAERDEKRAAADSLLKAMERKAKANDGIIDEQEQRTIDMARYGILSGNTKMLEAAYGGEDEYSFGRSLEGSAISNILAQVPPEQRADVARRMSEQIASRARTVSTPEGIYTIPGINLSEAMGAASGTPSQVTPPAGLTPRVPSEGESRDRYAADSMFDMEAAAMAAMNSGFDPTTIGAKVGENVNALASGSQQAYRAAADEFTTNLVFLRSGATAREDEKTSAFKNMFPQAFDKPSAVKAKEALRARQMASAIRKGFKDGRVGPEALVRIEELMARAEAADKEAQALFASEGGTGGDDVDALIEKYSGN